MKFSISLSLVLVSLVCPTSGAVLTEYDFTGVSLLPSTVDSHLSASPINYTGSTASHNTGVIVGVWANVMVVDRGAGATSATAAVPNNSYFQFDFAPNPGVTVDLTSLDFDAASSWSPTSTGSTWEVRSSHDGYASTLGSSSHLTSGITWTSFSVDLSGPDFQGLTTGLNFRVYVSDSVGNPSQTYDVVSLNGSAIPEPSVALLTLLGGLVLSLRRRVAC